MPDNSPVGLLLDLDGTLLDTAPCLTSTLNRLLTVDGLPPVEGSRIRELAGDGTVALLKYGYGALHEPQLTELSRRFLEAYDSALCHETQLSPAFATVLERCAAEAIPWGIVTNKPAHLTLKLLDALNLLELAGCVVCGDTLAARKPDAVPMFYAAELIMRSPSRCIYVGDAERDVQAGKAAGMKTVVAKFGYLSAADKPENWGADGIINDPLEVIPWITLR